MNKDTKYYNLLVAGAPRAITSSTNATPTVITMAAVHGLSTGARVQIMGHTTNVKANGLWTVTVTSTTKFSLDGSTAGGVGADGIAVAPAPRVIFVEEFDYIVLDVVSDGGGDYAGVIHPVGSIGDTAANFAGTISKTNMYEFLDFVDIETATSIDGDTGVTVAGADQYRTFRVDVKGLTWFTVIHSSGTAGELTINARLYQG